MTVLREFAAAKRAAERVIGPMRVTLRVGTWDDFEEQRAFAYCVDGDPIMIVVAPDFAEQPAYRRVALLRHEFGHAIEFAVGPSVVLNMIDAAGYSLAAWGGVERRADAVAEVVYGAPIGYDTGDVQTIRGGVRPRPLRLGR